jgi:hypothetical protein
MMVIILFSPLSSLLAEYGQIGPTKLLMMGVAEKEVPPESITIGNSPSFYEK